MLCGIVSGFVVHAPDARIERFEERLRGWIARFGNIFIIENVPGRTFEPAIERLPEVPLCLDTGHFLLEGKKPVDAFERWFGRITEIHLHGTANGKDHVPIVGDEAWFIDCAPLFKRFTGTIHIEIFDYRAIVPMLGMIEKYTDGKKEKWR
jgi:sugar phosphate isomerase/epimerase